MESLQYTPKHVLAAAHLCTHVVVAYGQIDPETRQLTEKSGAGEQLVRLKRANPHLKIMLSIGGWNNAERGFVQVVDTPKTRETFNVHAANWLRTNGYDGIDINWEYPGAEERGSQPADKRKFAHWITEMRLMFQAEAFQRKKERLIISAAVPASSHWVNKGFEVRSLCTHLDFVNLMSYDLHGDWVKPLRVGHHAGLGLGGGAQYSVEAAVNMWNFWYTGDELVLWYG